MAGNGGTMIVGAGPSGLLLAHMLLSNPTLPRHLLPITILEAGSDPRIPMPLFKSRQYCVGLSARGRDAIGRVKGLWEEVQKEGVPTSQFILHSRKRSISLKRSPDKPSLLINQRSLAATLLTRLEDCHAGGRLKVYFNTACVGADFGSQTVTFMGNLEGTVSYNLLVGGDGARSTVRTEFIRQRAFDYQQISMPYYFKVLHVPRPSELADYAVHSFRLSKEDSEEKAKWPGILIPLSQSEKSFLQFGCFPTPNNGMSVLIEWSPDSIPKDLLQIKEPSELKAYIERYMPPLRVPLEAAEAFISQRPTSSMKVKCSRFHDVQGRAVLVGDAAHAMSNALGQGCNSSLQDAVALDNALHEEADLTLALEKYSTQQIREDHAAAYLSEHAFPQAKWLLPFFLVGNVLSAVLSKTIMAPLIAPSIQSLCSETLVPYSEIVQRHKLWLSVVELTNMIAAKRRPSLQ
ncbi:hypothetical protein O6H91_20G018200 [Diphasiastrum complanatum]|nr:hypothetical protein O6H91_20G018200 [Diphasiastrum complanatum]KAJ7518992.1 hypothetical protein O6H91_20G018200 [Diphasiastrum complanatum]KAJ7518993.1 hypothetical protein O6H91_20G018200 [Diphasiastrum complanatum]KAJ7518994.1 hypothetical protein O6H91_20G018200 [Diphasiastrum complanatum]KAJ7518996.1 hypothetical protein O6H91_20G018200 [Diphasiastrum complanatum]